MTISVTEQPLKIPFVAAVVLHVNSLKAEFAAQLLEKAGQAAQLHISSGLWREAKLVLRFLACLQGLFEGDGIFPLLEELFARAGYLQTASSVDVRYVPIILYCIVDHPANAFISV